jgi:hypothetical protein
MLEQLLTKSKFDAKDENIYYTLVDCCSGQSYVYPEGHYLAGFPIYILYDGNYDSIAPEDIIVVNQPEIIISVTDVLGFEIKGCFILKATTAPVGQAPINLQNWYDVFYSNLITTAQCCDCNASCNSLFFTFSGFIQYGQAIFPFIGPTGNYNGRNYYSFTYGPDTYYVFYWPSGPDGTGWYITRTLGNTTGGYAVLFETWIIPAEVGITACFDSEGNPCVVQSYICKAPQPVVPPTEYSYPEERYQLTCCSTGNALIVNGLPAVFVFKGLTSNDNHPDNFLEVVLTTIKDINANVITGCYRVTEAECFEEWEEVLWQDFFVETECVSTCQECLPKPEVIPPITNHKTIYPDYIINNVDPDKAEQIFCAFGDANYEKVLALRFGVQFCCPTDLMQSTIEHEILKMDIAEDVNACCPIEPLPGTCKKYTITIPVDVEGWLYFKDCSGIVRTVLFYAASQPHEVFVCGVTGQTTAEIYILTTSHNLLQVQFVEGIDCN